MIFEDLGQSGYAIPTRPTPTKSAPSFITNLTSSELQILPVEINGKSLGSTSRNLRVSVGVPEAPSGPLKTSQHEMCRASISVSTKRLAYSRLSSNVIPSFSISGEILTTTTNEGLVRFLTSLMILIKKRERPLKSPPHESDLRLVTLPRN